jgi:excisionase family DNA binding protein
VSLNHHRPPNDPSLNDPSLNRYDELLRPREVAEVFGVRTTSIARWAREGRITAVFTPGGHRRYRRADVQALLDADAAAASPSDREQDAVRLYEMGWSIRWVAQEFGMSYGAMRRLLIRHVRLRNRHGAG